MRHVTVEAHLQRMVTACAVAVLLQDLGEVRERIRGTMSAVVAGRAVSGEVGVPDVVLVIGFTPDVGHSNGHGLADLLLDREVPALGHPGLEVAPKGCSQTHLIREAVVGRWWFEPDGIALALAASRAAMRQAGPDYCGLFAVNVFT